MLYRIEIARTKLAILIIISIFTSETKKSQIVSRLPQKVINYIAHVQTIESRLFFSAILKSLGMRLRGYVSPNILLRSINYVYSEWCTCTTIICLSSLLIYICLTHPFRNMFLYIPYDNKLTTCTCTNIHVELGNYLWHACIYMCMWYNLGKPQLWHCGT